MKSFTSKIFSGQLIFWAWLAWHCKMAYISLICFYATNSRNQPNSIIMFHAWGGKSRWGNKTFCTYFMCLSFLLLLLHIIWILLLRNNSNRKIVIKIVEKMFSILFGKMAWMHQSWKLIAFLVVVTLACVVCCIKK